MKKSELKSIIKECVKEILFEEGVLSNLVAEVAFGITKAQNNLLETRPAKQNNKLMDPLDPALQSTAVSGVKPLLTLAIFAGVGSFFLGALISAIRRGMKEEGWFKFKQEKEEEE